MNLAARARRRMTVPDFIAWCDRRPDEERWELLEGEPVLMAPPGERHQRVVWNIMRLLGPALEARGCVPMPGLGILSDTVDDYAPIPDVVVRCGPPVAGGYAKDPVFVAEVLSPSSMTNDRGRKVDFYKSVESLRAFAVVYADEPRVEAWRRDGEGWAFRVASGLSGVLDLPDLATGLALADIYRDVPFTGD
jgi:Uma2 family endonuclease